MELRGQAALTNACLGELQDQEKNESIKRFKELGGFEPWCACAQAACAATEPEGGARGGGGAAGEEALQLQELALPQAVLRVLCVRALLRWLQLRQLLQQQGERASPPGRRGGHSRAQSQCLPAQDPGA